MGGSDGAGSEAGGDLVGAAVEELYGADPAGFTARRTALAAAASSAGDRAAAKDIGALRRPTRAAWVVNRLARADPGAPARLAELAGALRAAQQAGHGPRLRELSAARGALVDALTGQAFGFAGVPDPPPALRAEVAGTLTAAVADADVAAAFAGGTLTKAVQWSGFGVLPAVAGAEDDGTQEAETAARGAGTDTSDRNHGGGAESDAARPRPRLGVVQGGLRAAGGAAAGSVTAGSVTAAGRRASAARPAAEAAAQRQAEQAERLARDAAERAARRREQYADAERAVASSAAAAADAVAAEDRLESEVRDLEERLTRARADLAAVRMRARHAEAAERRARQALDRLPVE